MARFVYTLENGIAMNVRAVKSDYELTQDEHEVERLDPPLPEELSDPVKWQERIARKEAAKNATTANDVLQALLDKGVITQQDIAKAKEKRGRP